jgi:hypothetical protein
MKISKYKIVDYFFILSSLISGPLYASPNLYIIGSSVDAQLANIGTDYAGSHIVNYQATKKYGVFMGQIPKSRNGNKFNVINLSVNGSKMYLDPHDLHHSFNYQVAKANSSAKANDWVILGLTREFCENMHSNNTFNDFIGASEKGGFKAGMKGLADRLKVKFGDRVIVAGFPSTGGSYAGCTAQNRVQQIARSKEYAKKFTDWGYRVVNAWEPDYATIDTLHPVPEALLNATNAFRSHIELAVKKTHVSIAEYEEGVDGRGWVGASPGMKVGKLEAEADANGNMNSWTAVKVNDAKSGYVDYNLELDGQDWSGFNVLETKLELLCEKKRCSTGSARVYIRNKNADGLQKHYSLGWVYGGEATINLSPSQRNQVTQVKIRVYEDRLFATSSQKQFLHYLRVH